MKKICLSLAAIAALLVGAGSASAQFPQQYPQQMPQQMPGAYPPGYMPPHMAGYGPMHTGIPVSGGCATCTPKDPRFGLHPALRRLFNVHSCDNGGGRTPPQVLPVAQPGQGTLAFPQNPFIRSPRDFFMYE